MRARTALAIAGLVAGVGVAVPVAPAWADADGCEPGMLSDFNGDGYSDAVVADPRATVSGHPEAGRIVVLYGDNDGRIGEGSRQTLFEGAAGVGGTAETGDRFGSSVTAFDADCDGYTDVAVGIPLEDVGAVADAGQVRLLWGGPGGLGSGGAATLYQSTTFGIPLQAAARFGAVVDGVEDVGQGGTPEPDAHVLAIGVPGATVEGHPNAGAVAVRAAYDGGWEYHWITEASPGIPGNPETGDGFGSAVSCNWLLGGSDIDCVVGVPGENVGSVVDAGNAVLIRDLYFSDEYTATSIGQNSAGVPNSAETGDRYGFSVDTVRVGSTGRLAIGAPGEGVGSRRNAGLVQLFATSGGSLVAQTALHQNTPGVDQTAEAGDRFGWSLAWIAPGLGDSRTRLAVGVPDENTSAGVNAGLVQVFPMGALTSDRTWTQDSAGVPGAAAEGDRFGASLAAVHGVTERAFLVGVPDDAGNGDGMVDVIPLGGGSPRAWIPGQGGVPGSATRFGTAMAAVHGGGSAG